MNLSDFDFNLPEELIALRPLRPRPSSRMLVAQEGRIENNHFSDICSFLRPGDLLVLNNTKVIPARLRARKETGGEVEILVERIVSGTQVLAQLRVSKKPAAGSSIELEGGERCLVLGREGEFFELQLEHGNWHAVLAFCAIGLVG